MCLVAYPNSFDAARLYAFAPVQLNAPQGDSRTPECRAAPLNTQSSSLSSVVFLSGKGNPYCFLVCTPAIPFKNRPSRVMPNIASATISARAPLVKGAMSP